MIPAPESISIFHITHVDNLPAILSDGSLHSDRRIADRGGPSQAIGIGKIKLRRMTQIAVGCHQGTHVGDFVPFYFCPRSVMLYLIDRANHPELTYRGGSGQIVHLESNFTESADWADENRRRWAFTMSNAGAYGVQFRSKREDLRDLDWASIRSADFRNSNVRVNKQAEFLFEGSFPFDLVRRIGVRSAAVAKTVQVALAAAKYKPVVEVRPDWYY